MWGFLFRRQVEPKPDNEMRLSEAGADFIASWEGEILKVYDDGFGYPTLGIGHLLTPEEKARMPIGTPITKEQSREYFRKDVKRFEDAVNSLVKVPLSQNQFDALVSFSFNIGVAGLKKSSTLRRLNAGNYTGAANAMLMWVRAGGRKVKGLIRRRTAERKLFLQ